MIREWTHVSQRDSVPTGVPPYTLRKLIGSVFFLSSSAQRDCGLSVGLKLKGKIGEQPIRDANLEPLPTPPIHFQRFGGKSNSGRKSLFSFWPTVNLGRRRSAWQRLEFPY